MDWSTEGDLQTQLHGEGGLFLLCITTDFADTRLNQRRAEAVKTVHMLFLDSRFKLIKLINIIKMIRMIKIIEFIKFIKKNLDFININKSTKRIKIMKTLKNVLSGS